MKNEMGQQHKPGIDSNLNQNIYNYVIQTVNDGFRYQTNVYTVVVNETLELRLQCAFNANPDKLRIPVKWLI